MRIPCPHCGERDAREFVYHGDAAVAARPEVETDDALARFVDHTYFRDNPAGPHRELWYHAGGCQAWLTVTRDTRSHAILAVDSCKPRTLGEA